MGIVLYSILLLFPESVIAQVAGEVSEFRKELVDVYCLQPMLRFHMLFNINIAEKCSVTNIALFLLHL